MEIHTPNASLPGDWSLWHHRLQSKVVAKWCLGISTKCDNVRWGYEVVLDWNNHQETLLGAYEQLQTIATLKVSGYFAFIAGNTCAADLKWSPSPLWHATVRQPRLSLHLLQTHIQLSRSSKYSGFSSLSTSFKTVPFPGQQSFLNAFPWHCRAQWDSEKEKIHWQNKYSWLSRRGNNVCHLNLSVILTGRIGCSTYSALPFSRSNFRAI